MASYTDKNRTGVQSNGGGGQAVPLFSLPQPASSEPASRSDRCQHWSPAEIDKHQLTFITPVAVAAAAAVPYYINTTSLTDPMINRSHADISVRFLNF